MTQLSYNDIQTPSHVWKKLLELNPIPTNSIFLEPFAGQNSLYGLIECEKDWCEIDRQRNIFDYDFHNSFVSYAL